MTKTRPVLLSVLLLLALVRPAFAQDDATQVLRDFIHYTKIARFDAASITGRQLLDQAMDPAEFVALIEEADEGSRFVEAIALGLRRPDLEDTAAALQRLYEQGRLNRARSPDEVERNIALLTGTRFGRLLARERLVEASEYAMPQLLKALLQNQDPALSAEVQRLMVDMGRSSILPLATALPGLDPARQERVVNVLGLIPYKTSLPFLHDLVANSGSAPVRQAAERAIARLEGDVSGVDVSRWYYELADRYYGERQELTSFQGEEFQLLWSYDPGLGLVMTPVRTEVFHEAMAMRMAERSMRLRDENPEALALWVASNFSRELDTPEGYENPAYPSTRRGAMYFCHAAGMSTAQRVLARAIDDRDTRLARLALASLESTAGANALIAGADGRRPLLEAMEYPNRRVQYEAAMAIGRAQPDTTFEGAERVVPTLAAAITNADERIALILTGDQERYQSLRQTLESLGYTVLPEARRLMDLEAALAPVGGVDLAVTALSESATTEAVAALRGTPKLTATPVLGLLPVSSYQTLSRRFGGDATIALRPDGISGDRLERAIEEVVDEASGGPITPSEARQYAREALSVLRDLAVSRGQVLNVNDAAMPLIRELGRAEGRTKITIAEVLSWMGQDRAQVAMMDAALNASGPERVEMMDQVASSARRYGSRLDERQIQRLTDVVESGDEFEATAAAALLGALNLSENRIIPLILSEN